MDQRDALIFPEEYLVVTRKINIFALYNVNKHSMPRQKREKSGTGICHVMQGKESKTCPCDFSQTQVEWKTIINLTSQIQQLLLQ